MPLFPPHGSLLWVPTYPLDSLKVPLLQQWRGRSQGEIRWRLRWPQNTSIDGNKEKLQHMLLCLYKQDDTNSWLVIMSLTSSGLLLCLCCLCVGLSISGCCSRGWPSLPGWYVLCSGWWWPEVCYKMVTWILQFKHLQLPFSKETPMEER